MVLEASSREDVAEKSYFHRGESFTLFVARKFKTKTQYIYNISLGIPDGNPHLTLTLPVNYSVSDTKYSYLGYTATKFCGYCSE